ncbi:MAG TPA: hypothetical protein VMF59_10755 [Bacteroidota bacterium]|nr:hypothetical protein [Bacteroidota bacterium]
MVAGSGWLKDGLWTWLGQIQGTDWALAGEQGRGYDYLYASANHASAAGTWVEEQVPRRLPPRTTGDFADAEGSAVFVHLVRVLLATDIGDTLHLLGDLPGSWLHPGGRLGLRDVATDLGRVTFRLDVSPDGNSALLSYLPVDHGVPPPHIIVNLVALSSAGFVGPDGSALPSGISIRTDRPWSLAVRRPEGEGGVRPR